MATDSFIVYMKAEDIYPDIENDLETRLDTSDFELQIPSNIVKKQKVIGLIKNKLGEKVMGEFTVLIPKTYSYLTHDLDGNLKKAKERKKCDIKRKVKLEDYKHCQEAIQLLTKITLHKK